MMDTIKNDIEFLLIILAIACFVLCCFEIPTWVIAALYWAGVAVSRSIEYFKEK